MQAGHTLGTLFGSNHSHTMYNAPIYKTLADLSNKTDKLICTLAQIYVQHCRTVQSQDLNKCITRGWLQLAEVASLNAMYSGYFFHVSVTTSSVSPMAKNPALICPFSTGTSL